MTKIALAEHFHSIQGEGTYVGVPMHFLRLAGCSVGRRNYSTLAGVPVLPTGETAWRCASWDGRPFFCDTDFNKSEDADVGELSRETWEKHVCISGGEPLIHQGKGLWELMEENLLAGRMVHLETSGTIVPIHQVYDNQFYPGGPEEGKTWITVAPKLGAHDEVIAKANEVKILVDSHFNVESLPACVFAHENVFLCPINGITEVDKFNVELCMNYLERFPHWRLSVQVHKFLGLR